MDIRTNVTLNNGEKMPLLGLGVFQSANQTYNAVRCALEAGYRHIDTASLYGNEEAVGRAVRESGIPRKEIFVTTKLWNTEQRSHRQSEAFYKSMERLNIGYIDLYLLHWPVPEAFKESWAVLEELCDGKNLKSIGVSNFLEHHIDTLMQDAKIKPAVDQVEIHPYNTKKDLRRYLKEHGIACEALSPLGRDNKELITDPTIAAIGQKYGKSVAQTILRWDVQNGIITIPKSVHAERILQNSQIFDFELDAEEMQKIESLNRNQFHEDPETFCNFF
ncbi:MAG: aldo/keto reductase [Lachnospiraceae bacterium]|nr:aldo/keto reductase [Lachnospiraceae bacterium]